MINHGSISVVIQGPIDWTTDKNSYEGTTLTLTKSIRALMPLAEIIVSTWENEKIEGLEFDQVIFSKQPRTQGDWPGFAPSNVNRQIVSTCAGLKASKRRYTLKVRSDMVVEGLNFIEVFEEKTSERKLDTLKNAVFDQIIVANNFSSRNTCAILERLPDHPLLFHPSDHLQFGLTTDLLKLWDVPLQTDLDAYHFLDRSHPNRWRLGELSRLAPEQHIFVNCLQKYSSFEMKHFADDRAEILALSEHFMNTHFVFIPDQLFPVRFAKYHTPHHFSFEWMRINHTGLPAPEAAPISEMKNISSGWKRTFHDVKQSLQRLKITRG